jgi:hypothetical protein
MSGVRFAYPPTVTLSLIFLHPAHVPLIYLMFWCPVPPLPLNLYWCVLCFTFVYYVPSAAVLQDVALCFFSLVQPVWASALPGDRPVGPSVHYLSFWILSHNVNPALIEFNAGFGKRFRLACAWSGVQDDRSAG